MTTARSTAKQLVAEYPDTALNLALEVVRLVALELAAKTSERPAPAPYLRVVETPATIVAAVCVHFGVTERALKASGRTKRIAHARAIAMRLMRVRLRMTFGEIGDLFGRDHTTAISACRRATNAPELLPIAIQLNTVRA